VYDGAVGVVVRQLSAVDRVIFCLFLPDEVQCYSVWMCKYFPLSAADTAGGSGHTRE